MSATVHQLPRTLTTPGSPSLPLSVDAGTRLLVVAPDAVPPGAVLLGHLVAVPLPVPVPAATPPAAVASQAAPPSTKLAGGAGLHVDLAGRRAVADGQEIALTRLEFELLAHLVTHPGHALTREHLLEAVWHQTAHGHHPQRTVDVHVSRVRRKLGRHGRALQSLRGVGYRWSDDDTSGDPR